ncbi:MAG: Ldh family oxidoreductase [Pseudomonadota bacterium]|nr:Ldh family oxidoreductase [Pseudomonadota bacterium]
MKTVTFPLLEEKLLAFLQQYFPAEVAQRCAEVMLWAEMHGKNGQGLLKLLGKENLQSVRPEGDLEIIRKTPVSVLINAHRQPSFYAAQIATDHAVEIGQKNGFALVGVNSFYTSTGALGFYAERLAKAGMIGLVMARSPGSTAPFSTKTPLFGTNPLAFGFPTMGEPLVFDMATSAITWYELVLAKMRGEAIPENVAIDRNGHPTTDPDAAMRGALLPFDRGHKGSGLGMMVEMLCGPLVGAGYCDFETYNKDWGFFILAFRPDLLTDLETFRKTASDLVRIVREQPSTGGQPVRLPGDAGRAFAGKIVEKGEISVEDKVAELLGF